MDKSEFILLIPAIIYGVAMVDLLKIFWHNNKYWEGVAWGIAMFLNLIVSWFGLYDKLETISSNILYFTAYIVSPLIFAQAVFVLTPEEEHTDTKAYFLKAQKPFFSLMLLYVVINILLSFIIAENNPFGFMRVVVIFPFIAVIIWPKLWTRAILLATYYIFALYIFVYSML